MRARLSPRLTLSCLAVSAWLVMSTSPTSALVPEPSGTQPPTSQVPRGVWPLDPEPSVVEPFAMPEVTWGPGHRGVDLAGSPGQVVLSALAGEIGFVGTVAGKPVVTVIHGTLRTTYEPVVSTLSSGDAVGEGSPIGRLVVVSSHCFPDACLHWGLRRETTYLDPLSLVGGGPVRLLPLWRDQPSEVGGRVSSWTPVLRDWVRPLDVLPYARGCACW